MSDDMTETPEKVPQEVVEASKRLEEREPLKTAPLPHIFKEIIKNDNERHEILKKGSSMTREDWRRLRQLTDEKNKNLRPAAERALSWGGGRA